MIMNAASSTAESAASELMALACAGGLNPLRLGGRTLLPVVLGGMGVGVFSAHRLAGSVVALGALGYEYAAAQTLLA